MDAEPLPTDHLADALVAVKARSARQRRRQHQIRAGVGAVAVALLLITGFTVSAATRNDDIVVDTADPSATVGATPASGATTTVASAATGTMVEPTVVLDTNPPAPDTTVVDPAVTTVPPIQPGPGGVITTTTAPATCPGNGCPDPNVTTTTDPYEPPPTTAPPPPGTPMGLAQAIALWESSRPQRYSMTLQRLCFCTVESVQPFTVVVDGTTIVSSTGEDPLTIDQIFAFATTAANTEPTSRVYIWVDTTLGIPVHIATDPVAMMADDEMTFIISDFHAL